MASAVRFNESRQRRWRAPHATEPHFANPTTPWMISALQEKLYQQTWKIPTEFAKHGAGESPAAPINEMTAFSE
jgi:hypothetical protein